MALASTIVGDGILVDSSSDINIYYQRIGYTLYKMQETTITEVREWVALTQAAAYDAAVAASQVGVPEGGVFSYVASEDMRVVASYKLTRTMTNKTTNTPW